MGFDIECIIDIHTYPGEYFCPVCRTLVFPNEAVQSQCTHLYCKPCLAHVANGSRACPYDGYLVTEADSKPLIESDKTLAESLGRVKVRCLYHRSGCTWEGPLSDNTSHCSACSFGNSPVICNRCGVQIVHRQVHEHALSCPGVYPAQQTANGTQDNPSSGAATTAGAGAESNQTTAQSGTPASQTPNPQTLTASVPPGQDPNQQTNGSSQALATASAGVPTSDQWYQQQYQQYYQQYAGYDPYQQQTYQQYYPYQQQPVQQYQQPQIYMQPPAQTHTPVPTQPQPQPQSQPLNPQSQPQMQALPKGQTQSQVQALAQQNQNQVQVNPQQQLPPTMQLHTQIPSQIYPTSRAQPPNQPPPYPQPYPMQPHSQHHVQVPQYQQPPAQVHLPPSSQGQPHPPVQPQPHSLLQPQINVQHLPQSHGQLRPPQASQPAHAPGQTLHSTANTVSGFHSYPQPQPMQQAPVGINQQTQMRPHPTSGSMPPVQTQGQVTQQPPLVRPPQGLVANQQPGLVPSQGQAPAQSQLYPTAQQAGHPIQQHPVQPNQQPMPQQYSQQHTFPGPFLSQSHQQGHFTHQQPLQSQFRPQGLPNAVPQNLHAYIQPQQNVALPPPPQPQQSQTYIGRPGMQNHVQVICQAHGGYNTAAQVRPIQPALSQPQMNPSYGNRISNEHESIDQKKRSSLESKSDELPDKTAGRPEVGVSSQDNAQKDLSSLAQSTGSDINVHKGDSDELMDKRTVKEEGNEYSLEPKSAAKSADATVKPEKDAYDDAPKELDQALANHASSDATDGSMENLNPGRNSHDATVDAGGFQQYGHEMPPPKYGPSGQQRSVGPMMIPPMQPSGRSSHAQGPGYPPNAMMPSGDVPQAGQPFNSRVHHPQFLKQPSSAPLCAIPGPGSTAPFARGHGHFPPPGDFREGITGMGRAPLSGPEIHSGTQHSVNPAEAEMFQNQRVNRFDGNQPNPFPPGSFDKVPFGQPRGMESARDTRLKAPMGEHLSPLPVTHDQASRLLDKPPRGLGYDSGSKFEASAGVPPNRLLPPYHPPGSMHFKGSGEREAQLGPHDDDRKRAGSGFGAQHMDYLSARNPDGEFFNIPPRGFASHSRFDDIGGREPRQFIEGPGPFNLPSNQAGGLFSDGRFQTLPGHPHGGEIDGLGDLRGSEHATFGHPYKHVRSGDLFGKDVPSHLHHVEPLDPQKLPSHLCFGEPAGFGPFAGRPYMGELSGFGDIPGFGESIGRNKPGMPRFGEPGFRSRYPVPGFLNHGLYAGDVDSFDRLRKRKPVSMGWCRICKVDCETVEGLDMHSQTREHQDMAMDMVRSIKEQNRKKQKTFSDRASVEEKGKTRKAVFEGRGRKT
ncbi:chromatin modification-related protein eaf-1-like [Lycium barbarum]|uniref:chromatin modification-related protein eaf-1-like n=1 Tax=Lycium barbarum TaxID=112863 RepID=UPI00293E8A5D|nr:chromatin modification-related protein eaf-1-like [Lycium barbarum]XP_060202601.1 chromatin modification-related protein eaf-1-like [Lycium barbarum]XP_060202602.1 chromatin modification-related protein eaf-1-like [Lycium barbarum]